MEFALPELLSRGEILTILNQRHLQIHNLSDLTHEELLRVYKTFVVPLSRRPERSKRSINTPGMSTTRTSLPNKSDNYEEQMSVEPFHVDNTCVSMDIDIPHRMCIDEQLGTHGKMTSPLGEKRRQRDSDDDFIPSEKDYQYLLSSATKRIKLNSLS